MPYFPRMDTTHIQRARDIVGGTNEMARLLKVSPATVSEWVSGRRPVPARHCRPIEDATTQKGDTVSCQQLLPEVFGPPPKKPRAKAAA